LSVTFAAQSGETIFKPAEPFAAGFDRIVKRLPVMPSKLLHL
jgi:hypothetical protein